MSKGNMLLGFTRGAVGDVVFTRIDGEQVTRARNRSPKNPRTARQCLQRCVLKTVAQAYSVVQSICDHSFEGLQVGTPNQSKFSSLNVAMLRDQLEGNVNLSDASDIINSELFNYAAKDLMYPVVNPYIVSAGSLPTLTYSITANYPVLSAPGFAESGSYADLVNALGLERGDQLTFLWIYSNDQTPGWDGLITGFEFSRVILEPSNNDMTTAFMNFEDGVNNPNESNQGRIRVTVDTTGQLKFTPAAGVDASTGQKKMISGCAVIASRKFGSTWRRSTQALSLHPDPGLPNDERYLGDAVLSFMDAAEGSSLYLNQADNIV